MLGNIHAQEWLLTKLLISFLLSAQVRYGETKRSAIHGERDFLPYWYLISWVPNFMILARQYFAGFIVAISIGKYEKKPKKVVNMGEDFYSRVFNCAIFLQSQKMRN